MNIHDQLRRPFPLTKIHWRVGNTNAKKLGCKPWEATEGAALAYVDARDVMKRLDDVLSTENWQCRYPISDNGLLICEIGIRASIFGLDRGDWIWKSNGAGETDIEAKKGACSQALVRAGVVWGIGQYLYALPFSWVDLDRGKLSKGTIAMLGESMPTWASPEGFDQLMEKKRQEKTANE